MATEQITVPDEVIALVGRLAIENALLQQRLADASPPEPPPREGGADG